MELNARLQVEHPVSELVTGIDIVREQVCIAAGEALPATGRAKRSGHAIEIRINAEDPARGFAPDPGVIERFRPPLGPGVRVDTHVEEGVVIPPHYDSLIAKVLVWDDTREHAIHRTLRALADLDVRGVATTRDAAMDVLRSDEFVSGRYSTGFFAETEGRLPALAPR
jgi:acetyl-CoA carboxylase biotin carboxylase subunit